MLFDVRRLHRTVTIDATIDFWALAVRGFNYNIIGVDADAIEWLDDDGEVLLEAIESFLL